MKSSHRNKIALILCCLTACFSCSPSRPVHAQSLKDAQGRQDAPDFALKDVNGKLVHLADFKGKVVVVDFWATWCGPCQMEIPWFMDFERKYKDQGFVMIGIAMDDDGWKSVKPFIEQMKMNYRVVLGNDQTANLCGGVEAIPTTILIDRAGKVAGVHVSLAGKEEFQDAIEKLLETPTQTSSAQLHIPSFRAK